MLSYTVHSMCFCCCHFQRSTLAVNGLMATFVTRRLKIFMYTVDDCRVLYMKAVRPVIY